MRLSPKLAEGGSADQVRLKVERVVDGGVGGEGFDRLTRPIAESPSAALDQAATVASAHAW